MDGSELENRKKNEKRSKETLRSVPLCSDVHLQRNSACFVASGDVQEYEEHDRPHQGRIHLLTPRDSQENEVLESSTLRLH